MKKKLIRLKISLYCVFIGIIFSFILHISEESILASSDTDIYGNVLLQSYNFFSILFQLMIIGGLLVCIQPLIDLLEYLYNKNKED